MEAIAVLIVLVVAYFAYTSWLSRGISTRTFRTVLSEADIRSLFRNRVAKTGWKIVDDGNPMVAQSSLMTGIRQEIGLQVQNEEDHRRVIVGPERWVTSWGVPKKGHTIRIRLNSFVEAVRQRDQSIDVQLIDTK